MKISHKFEKLEHAMCVTLSYSKGFLPVVYLRYILDQSLGVVNMNVQRFFSGITRQLPDL